LVAPGEQANGLADEARRTFEKAAQLDADAMTWYRLGKEARADGRPFKADERFAKAAELDGSFAAPLVELAELALERLDEALKEEHEALIETAKGHVAAAEKATRKTPDPHRQGAPLGPRRQERRGRACPEEVRLHPEEPLSVVMLANVYAAEQKDAGRSPRSRRRAGTGADERCARGAGTLRRRRPPR
jgi:tetratricopeptide (TPR) repeat protein